jgi:hypothetical protein
VKWAVWLKAPAARGPALFLAAAASATVDPGYRNNVAATRVQIR